MARSRWRRHLDPTQLPRIVTEFAARCRRLLVELNLCAPDATLYVTQLTGGVASDIAVVQSAYARHTLWEDATALQARICALLPALMLARVDGKSPVEYLAPAHRTTVRHIAPPLILAPKTTLADLTTTLTHAFAES